ncbi:MAG TPA: Na+/H+ antiporter NhaC family protein [Thermoanaerobaculia bacterium]|nr:Na+/H+ antiporter NhaC family protein [Thermoanaerobaculia bacterium]
MSSTSTPGRSRPQPGPRRIAVTGFVLVTLLALAALASLPAFAAEDAVAAPTAAGTLWSLLPPLLAIVLAILTRDVLVSLFLGVFSGALLVHGPNPLVAFARTIDAYVLGALTDPDHAAILIFSGLLGAMVGVIAKSGGTQGIVEWLAPRATDARRGQLATWAMGVAIFFDDYANTLIVGSTMRPITDRLRISREKLAFMVDATAAPVVSLVPISTWIGFEIGLVQSAFDGLGLDRSAFNAIVASIPLRFYQLFILVLGLAIAFSRRDFGAMLHAERRAARTGAVLAEGDVPLADFSSESLAPPDGTPRRALNAFVPVLGVVVVTIAALQITGRAALAGTVPPDSWWTWQRDVFSNADSYKALLWASLTGVLLAIALPLGQRILSVTQATGAAVEGLKAALVAFVVLLLAWSLGATCADLDTAGFLIRLTEGELAPQLLPTLGFLIAAGVAFATGSSWSTMGILTPLVVPLAHSLSVAAGHQPGSGIYSAVLLGTVASVLSGSVWGDHCSPISDTTILSSMASGCDHLGHVRTQLPYALVAGAAAILLGTLPAAFGLPAWVALLLGAGAMVTVVWVVARPIEGPA